MQACCKPNVVVQLSVAESQCVGVVRRERSRLDKVTDTSVGELEADDVNQLMVPKEEARLSTRFSCCSAQRPRKVADE